MSYTYSQIQSRIADELNRSDLTSQIQKAIVSAIQHYDCNRTWFSEEVATGSTTASLSYVTCPTDMVFEDELQITVGGRQYSLSKVSYSEYVDESQVAVVGQPRDYAYFEDRFFLYPTPNSSYTLTISYFKTLTELSSSSDENGWTDFAEELIRSRAKADIRINIIHDQSAVQEALNLANSGCYSVTELSARSSFFSKNDQRLMRGFAKAYYL